MRLINRNAIIVKGKQPFVDWINSTEKASGGRSFNLDTVNNEISVFLIPSCEHPDEVEEYIDEIKPEIFEYMLNCWYTDKTIWPRSRTIKLFDEWFDWNYTSMINDMEEHDPLKHEDWDV